ncbi:MAG: hypothetical protein PF503_01850 [Desulfobacula sp.]|jgi:hypothetical protein|nr:hypothetical protein [Desulfobacula sp.]
MSVNEKRNNAEKIAIFFDRLVARTDVYGTYDPETGKTFQRKESVTKQVIIDHLQGKKPYGMYMLVKDKTTVLVIDFDDHDKNPPVKFINQAKHYNIPAYLEVSKSKGWHVWIFFGKAGVSAIKARTMAYQILNDIDSVNTEVFPKQNFIPKGRKSYGNFVNCPLFGKLIPQGKTIFVDPNNNFSPYEQWSFLKNVKLVTEDDLDELIEINDWKLVNQYKKKISKNTSLEPKLRYTLQALLPCAQKMLKSGVTRLQRLTCFRLAIHLCAAGFDEEMSYEILRFWAKRNKPINGKQILTEKEIMDQCKDGFKTRNSSYGCGEPETSSFCSKPCPLYKKNK